MAKLFEPLVLRDVTLRNRIAVAPMCMYSAEEGVPNDWHLIHLGDRAVGGAGLVICEATAVEPRGRISPGDTGIWNDAQAAAWSRITRFVKAHGAVAGIQLAHAGRKASTLAPWKGGAPASPEEGGWSPVVAPSAIAFDENHPTPEALTTEEIQELVTSFAEAAKRSMDAGFNLIEIHGAHGYLGHEFLSPISNHRTDQYGGSFENRIRFLREVVDAVRKVWPERLPLFVRISATDWVEDGWDLEQSIELARLLKAQGVDLIDTSSGGNVHAKMPIGPGYQVHLAEGIRREAGIATGAVGLITEPRQAEEILEKGQADLILLARELLRDPYWPRRAAKELGATIKAPEQYERAW